MQGYTPKFLISKAGIDITGNFNDRTTAITVELGNQDAADRFELTVDDRDWRIALPSTGDNLAISLGYEEIGIAFMGHFIVDEVLISGPPHSITIAGTSVDLASTLAAPIIDSFEGKTVSEIVTELAKSAGLSATVSASIGNTVVPFLNTVSSPLHQLTELAARFNAVPKFANGKVVFVPRDLGESAGGSTIPIVRLGPQHLASWQVRLDARVEFSDTSASYFDPVDQVRKWVTQRPEGLAFAALEAGSNVFQIGQMFGSKAEAEAAARSKMNALVRGSGTISATLAAGDPWLRDQQRLQLAGFRDGVTGNWITSGVRHSYGETGLTTTFEGAHVGTGADFGALEASEAFLIPLPGETLGHLLVGANGLIAGGV